MEWLIPWHAADDPSEGVDELRREISTRHPLHGVPVRSLAYRQDCDDVLFAYLDGSTRVAVVHLTFNVETDPQWPVTELYDSLEVFASTRMASDHADWVS